MLLEPVCFLPAPSAQSRSGPLTACWSAARRAAGWLLLSHNSKCKQQPCGAQTVIASEFCDCVFQRGLQDLNMLVAQHSRERTAAQWAATLGAGGFRLTRVVATRSAFSVVVAQPAEAS